MPGGFTQTLHWHNSDKMNADHKKVPPEHVISFIGQILSVKDKKKSSPSKFSAVTVVSAVGSYSAQG